MKAGQLAITAGIILMLAQAAVGRTVCDLKKAVEKKYIQASVTCQGGMELSMEATNLLKDSLYLLVPAGWRFESNAGKNDYQDMLMTRQEILAMKPKEARRFVLKGFCCEADKAGPKAGVPYTLGRMADSSLAAVARYLAKNPIDRNTQQYAVWAVSNNMETANITHQNDSLAGLIRRFVAELKGEPLPWYTLLKKSVITASGEVHDYPMRFNTIIPYTIPQDRYAYCYIVDEKGNTVSAIIGQWLLSREHEYRTSFQVSHLKKGEYKLVLVNRDESFFERSFRI